jgi:hypothetical protein
MKSINVLGVCSQVDGVWNREVKLLQVYPISHSAGVLPPLSFTTDRLGLKQIQIMTLLGKHHCQLSTPSYTASISLIFSESFVALL